MKNDYFREEDWILEGFQNVKTPETVKDRMEKTLHFLEESSKAEETAGKLTQKNAKKRLSFRRAAVIAAAAAVCIGAGATAASQIYRMQLQKEKEYQANVAISADAALPEEVAEVEIKVNYLPEGFELDSKKGIDHYYKNPEIADAGYWLNPPLLIDEADPLTILFAKEAETLEINGREAVYVNQQNTADGEWQNGTVYLVFEDVNRILGVEMWGYADKEELLKIAENVELVPTGNMVASADLPHWSEMIAMQQEEQAEIERLNEAADEETNELTADEEAMKNLHQVGDIFTVKSFADEITSELTLNASVTDVQTADNLALLEEALIPAEWKELVGEDGTLMPVTLDYVKEGDGVNTLDEVVRTEEKPVKLVYVTVEFTNTGDTAVKNAYFMGGMQYLMEEDGVYRMYEYTDDSYDYILDDKGTDRWEMGYYDVTGGARSNNYIPEIQPGETQAIHMAWLVTEDNLDHMYLELNGSGMLTEEVLATGLVELNMQ